VPLHDLPHGRTIRADASGVLTVPEHAVVVPGSRKAEGAFAAEHGIALYAPVIVKYRDARTDVAAALEAALR
jgi:2,3,4,5-tetrahydropyridine-2-carboxylate N-succinyltransferase